MNFLTIPPDLLPEQDPGIFDVTPVTLADRDEVARVREFLRNRDRNGHSRPTEPRTS